MLFSEGLEILKNWQNTEITVLIFSVRIPGEGEKDSGVNVKSIPG